jgi:hypothetical protein
MIAAAHSDLLFCIDVLLHSSIIQHEKRLATEQTSKQSSKSGCEAATIIEISRYWPIDDLK